MILLLTLSVWMLVLWLAVGLCTAARLGDRTRVEAASGEFAAERRAHGLWEPVGPTTISARAEGVAGQGERADPSLTASSLAA